MRSTAWPTTTSPRPERRSSPIQNGTDIVGAIAVSAGKATHVSGVAAKGYRLVIRLTRRDPTLLTKLAMPFFQATSLRLPLTREVVAGGYPSAGPYAFTQQHAERR